MKAVKCDVTLQVQFGLQDADGDIVMYGQPEQIPLIDPETKLRKATKAALIDAHEELERRRVAFERRAIALLDEQRAAEEKKPAAEPEPNHREREAKQPAGAARE